MDKRHDRAAEAGHSHAPTVNTRNEWRVGLAALLTFGFMLAEVAGGLVSGSLALLADAGHMVADVGALGLAWFAFRLARRPADWRRTYGFDRFSVLVAFVNGLALFAIAGVIVWHAAARLLSPAPVLGPIMLAVAAAGLLVNFGAWWLLSGADHGNVNVRGALLHVIGDLLGSAGAVVAALVIMATGWTPADPILSMLVAAIILRSAWGVTRDAGHILLEGAPAGMNADIIAADLEANVPGVAGVHHVHAWSITEARPMMTLHARIASGADMLQVRAAVRARLAERFDADHSTIEIELADEDDCRRC